MRYSIYALAFTSLVSTMPVLAGSDHAHGDEAAAHSHGPITSEAATTKAGEKLKQLVDTGKLDKSWSSAKSTNVTKKTFSKGPEWVVTFVNDQVSDKAKQTLYIFFSEDGHYLAANFTGQ